MTETVSPSLARGGVTGRGPLSVLAVGGLLALLSAGTFIALQAATALRLTWPAEADTFYLPSSGAFKTMALGHHEAAADLIAARTNVYFGTQMATSGKQRWLPQYINIGADLDPYFNRLYLAGSAMILYGNKAVDLGSMLAATSLLERGLEIFPLDWQLHFQLGFNYLFELPKLVGPDDRRLLHWRQEGVEALRRAALFEDVPYWLPSLVARVLTKSGGEEMAIRHLEQAYAVASSEQARAQIASKLKMLRGKQFSEQLEEGHRHFLHIVESRYPYAPDAFSVVAGARHPRSVDLETVKTPAAGTAKP